MRQRLQKLNLAFGLGLTLPRDSAFYNELDEKDLALLTILMLAKLTE